ncbi:MAG: hypothetical protein U5N85_09690 [Arcicella sp.]|nr:hypothetical protein [Arcicella sp.]
MKKISLFTIILLFLVTVSCNKKEGKLQSNYQVSIKEALTSKMWKIDKVTQFIEGKYQTLYNRNTSLFAINHEFNSVRIKFLQNQTMQIYDGIKNETGKWDFINHNSQIRSKKFNQKDFIVLHINRIESEELVFSQVEDSKIVRYEFSPI